MMERGERGGERDTELDPRGGEADGLSADLSDRGAYEREPAADLLDEAEAAGDGGEQGVAGER
jgi:hypothetical protein